MIAECHRGQGIALGGLPRLPEARDAFARALEFDPDNERAPRDLACMLHDLRIINQRACQRLPAHLM
jgi:Flp pilus assembly protein TadD